MFLFCLVFTMSLCASVYMCFVVTCWERADPLGSRLWCLIVSLLLGNIKTLGKHAWMVQYIWSPWQQMTMYSSLFLLVLIYSHAICL